MASSPGKPLNEQGVQRISRFGVRFGNWNLGSICKRATKACEELRKRKVDVCCNQRKCKMERTWSMTYWCRKTKMKAVLAWK